MKNNSFFYQKYQLSFKNDRYEQRIQKIYDVLDFLFSTTQAQQIWIRCNAIMHFAITKDFWFTLQCQRFWRFDVIRFRKNECVQSANDEKNNES